MVWLHAQDISYYSKESIKKLCDEYKVKKFLIHPNYDEINKELRDFNDFAVISFEHIPKGAESFFVYKRLDNVDLEILTTQQKKHKASENEALYQKYGLKVFNPSKTLADYGGAFKLKQWIKSLEVYRAKGIPIKPVFLLGVQGAGKSEFVLCYAGEKKAKMLDLNLSLVMEDYSPLKKLNEIFEYLSDTQIEVVLRIDEITEMLSNEFLFGELLTLLNDLNTKDGYQINGELMASANQIEDVVNKKPQFFRHGRWNKKFFFHYPTKDEGLEIFKYYNNIYQNGFSPRELEYIFNISLMKHKSTSFAGRSPYVPSEINALMAELTAFDAYEESLFTEHIEGFIPQSQSALQGTYSIINQNKKLGFTEL